MSVWQSITWYVARAGGFTAFGLLTLAVIAGLALTSQWQSSAFWPRLINNEMHNFLMLLSAVFIVVHVLAVWIDPFTHFSWNEVFLPLVSHYRPQWVAFGIVSLYLGIAIGLSTLIRPWIGYRWWRRLHILTLIGYAGVLVHGIGSGTDSPSWWGIGIYLISIVLVGTLLCRRLLVPAGKNGRTHPWLAALTMLCMFAAALWTLVSSFT